MTEISVKTGTCTGCGREDVTLIKEVIGRSVDDWAMFCDECSTKHWFTDPMEVTVKQLVEYFGATEPSGNPLVSNPYASQLLQFAFSKMHPVEFLELVRLGMQGLDDGPTQGSYHPHLQQGLEALRKDPEDRFQ